MELKDIDITFDVRRDSFGKDPDSASGTMRIYHMLLWSKTLPCGLTMRLMADKGYYLRWKDMYLGSDSIIVSFYHGNNRMKEQLHREIEDFDGYRESYLRKACTIAGYVIFPQTRWSINKARGCHPRICDRWDLTLECIRRYYHHETSPLSSVLEQHKAFLDLFVDFKGYVDFFLLQDCVDESYNVRLWLDTPLFSTYPMPRNTDEYRQWIDNELDFLDRRGKRILDYIANPTCDITSKAGTPK